jgi:hypothetical protein
MRFRRALIGVAAVSALLLFFTVVSPMRRYPTDGMLQPAATEHTRAPRPIPAVKVVAAKVQILPMTQHTTLPEWASDPRAFSLRTLEYLQQVAIHAKLSNQQLRYVVLRPGTGMRCGGRIYGGTSMPYTFCGPLGAVVIDLDSIDPPYLAKTKRESQLGMVYDALERYVHALVHQSGYTDGRLCLTGAMLRALHGAKALTHKEAATRIATFYRPSYDGSALRGFTQGTCSDGS